MDDGTAVLGRVEVDAATLDTPSLGNRGYLLTDGAGAVAVDPPRDTDRALRWLAARDVPLRAVLETHVHEDHVSGGLDLARSTGARYVVPAGPILGFDATRVGDGDVLELGDVRLDVMATSGHAPEHVAYRLLAGVGGPVAVLSGGALLAGGVPRQDLDGAGWSELRALEQHRSVRRLVAGTPGSALVLPGHGFSRFGPGRGAPAAPLPLSEQGRITRALQLEESRYVAESAAAAAAQHVTGFSLAAVNAAGPAPMDLSFAARYPLHISNVRRRLQRAEWVVDVRPREAFAERHLRGSLNIEVTGALAACIAWLVPANRRLTLIGDDEDQLTAAYRDVGGVGMDRVDVAFLEPGELRKRDLGRIRRVGPDALASPPNGVVLDVRLPSEWGRGHVPGAISVPLAELALRPPLPHGRLWVYSATGFRAAVAASLLTAWGRDAVLVDGELLAA